MGNNLIFNPIFQAQMYFYSAQKNLISALLLPQLPLWLGSEQ